MIRGCAAGFLLLAAGLTPASVRAQHFPPDAELRTMLRYSVEDGEAPGVVLGVLEADGTTRVVSYGSGGPDTRPLGPRSQFEIGSLTKTFTATLLSAMAADGEVGLDDPLSKFLPDSVRAPSRNGRHITLEDLATHTSGLPLNPANYQPSDMRDPWADYDVATMYAFLSGYTLPRDPGAQLEYSNVGYGVLGFALGRAAREPYAELMRQRILEPLGMTQTGYWPQDEDAAWLTRGHALGAIVPYYHHTEAIRGAGGLYSDAEDMLKWLKANATSQKTPLQRAMHEAQRVRVPGREQGAGRGFSWSTVVLPRESPVVWHSGGTGGFSARIAFMPSKGIGTVLLANTYQFADQLGTTLLFPAPPPTRWARVEVPPDVLAEYAGEYRLTTSHTRYYVRFEPEGWLTYQAQGNVRARLYATSDSTFFILRGPWTFTFRRDASGAVVGMHMMIDERAAGPAGRTLLARRVGDDSPPPAVAAGNAGVGVTLRNAARRARRTAHDFGIRRWLLPALGLVAVLTALGLALWRRRRPAIGKPPPPAPPSDANRAPPS